MNVEIGAEAALFPEKEYINGIALAVQQFSVMAVAQKRIPQNPGCCRLRFEPGTYRAGALTTGSSAWL
jgi:hypothetical protein